MEVTVEVVGEGTRELDLDDVEARTESEVAAGSESARAESESGSAGSEAAPAPPTYADLCRAVGYSPHEVAVVVDGRPVPEDQPVEAERVRILRLVRGG